MQGLHDKSRVWSEPLSVGVSLSSYLLGKLKQRTASLKQISDVLSQNKRQKEVWGGGSVCTLLAAQASGPEFGSSELMKKADVV